VTAPAASNDKTTTWGVLDIVLGVCCWPLGLIFAILCLNESKKAGKPPTLAYVGFAVVALNLVAGIILAATGSLASIMGNS